MTNLTESLASFAAANRLTPSEAVYLPATLEVSARQVGIPQSEMLFKMHNMPELAQYICQTIRKAARAS